MSGEGIWRDTEGDVQVSTAHAYLDRCGTLVFPIRYPWQKAPIQEPKSWKRVVEALAEYFTLDPSQVLPGTRASRIDYASGRYGPANPAVLIDGRHLKLGTGGYYYTNVVVGPELLLIHLHESVMTYPLGK